MDVEGRVARIGGVEVGEESGGLCGGLSTIFISLIQVQDWIDNPGLDPLDFGWETCSESGECMPTQRISDICPNTSLSKTFCLASVRKVAIRTNVAVRMCDCDECENVKTG